MKRPWRKFWIQSAVFLLGFSVLPLAASGLFRGTEEEMWPLRETRPAFRNCGQYLATSSGESIAFWSQSPNGNYDCTGGPGGC